MTRTHVWSGLWLEQPDAARVISYSTSSINSKYTVQELFCAVRNEKDESLSVDMRAPRCDASGQKVWTSSAYVQYQKSYLFYCSTVSII